MVRRQHRKITVKTWLWAFAVVIILLTIMVGKFKYNQVFEANINLPDNKHSYLYIPTGSNYDSLFNILVEEELLIDTASFNWVAARKNLNARIYPGKYRIEAHFSNNDLIDILRSGRSEQVTVSFTKVRSIEALAGKISKIVEADSASITRVLRNDSILNLYQYDDNSSFNQNTILAAFIPNSYHFVWNSSAEVFLKRMVREYKNFWNDTRIRKARDIKMSPIEISTLASIVEEETQKNDEKPRMAGVYVNRLKRSIPLQADPTIKFALGDFAIRRITKDNLEVDSPYNTYKNAGLPPGPICTPSISSIDAVLNYETHRYLYFCAKEDFSGYHNFAKTLRQHNLNAKKYHRALNRKRIYK